MHVDRKIFLQVPVIHENISSDLENLHPQPAPNLIGRHFFQRDGYLWVQTRLLLAIPAQEQLAGLSQVQTGRAGRPEM